MTSNYRGISLSQTVYQILSNILLSRLTAYVDEIIGDHQCGFRRNRSTTDNIQLFCTRHILKNKWEYNETLHRLLIDSEKAYVSIRSILKYFHWIDIPVKLVRLIKMILNEICSKVLTGKKVSDVFLVQIGLKKWEALSPLLLTFFFSLRHREK
jgi:hypothetical protein